MISKNSKLYICIGGFIIVALIGYFIGKNQLTDDNIEADLAEDRHQAGYQYIKPLLTCSLELRDYRRVQSLEKELRKIVDEEMALKQITDLSLFFHDLDNGSWIAINRTEKFSPASLLKVPIMIAYFKLTESQPDLLKKEITVIGNVDAALRPNIMPEKRVEPGKAYTVEELIKYAVNYSDNVAANTLLENISLEDMERIYDDIGLEPPSPNKPENFMSVFEYSAFFEILYNASYLSKDMSEKALEILADTRFDFGIEGGVPEGTKVANKFGERTLENQRQLHDCGIIYSPEGPYLLCIMTRADLKTGASFQHLAEILESLSAKTYKYLSK